MDGVREHLTLQPLWHGYDGLYNGDRLSQRLVQCNSGFFVQVYYISTVFFLRELLHGARVLANTLHVTEVHPAAIRVRRSAVFIAGGASLLASRLRDDGLPRRESHNG